MYSATSLSASQFFILRPASMAGGAIVNTCGQKEHPGKMTLFVFLTCLVAATGGLIFGYDIGISGNFLIQKFLTS